MARGTVAVTTAVLPSVEYEGEDGEEGLGEAARGALGAAAALALAVAVLLQAAQALLLLPLHLGDLLERPHLALGLALGHVHRPAPVRQGGLLLRLHALVHAALAQLDEAATVGSQR